MEKSSSSPGIRKKKYPSVRRKKRSHDEFEKRKEEKEKSDDSLEEEQRPKTPNPAISPSPASSSPSSSPPDKKGFLLGKTNSTSENGFSYFFRRKTVGLAEREEVELLKEEKKRKRHRNRSEKVQANIRPSNDTNSQSDYFYTVSCEDVAESLPSKGVLVKCLEDLPPDVHSSIERMKVFFFLFFFFLSFFSFFSSPLFFLFVCLSS